MERTRHLGILPYSEGPDPSSRRSVPRDPVARTLQRLHDAQGLLTLRVQLAARPAHPTEAGGARRRHLPGSFRKLQGYNKQMDDHRTLGG